MRQWWWTAQWGPCVLGWLGYLREGHSRLKASNESEQYTFIMGLCKCLIKWLFNNTVILALGAGRVLFVCVCVLPRPCCLPTRTSAPTMQPMPSRHTPTPTKCTALYLTSRKNQDSSSTTGMVKQSKSWQTERRDTRLEWTHWTLVHRDTQRKWFQWSSKILYTT